MTAPQTPTPGVPLSAESVRLLKAGDVLCGPDGRIHRFDEWGDGGFLTFLDNDQDGYLASLCTFIGRPDAEGWMTWSGGENSPFPRNYDLKIQWRDALGEEFMSSARDLHCDNNIIAFRLTTPSDQGEEVLCSGCEGRPQYPNDPCAVCGLSTTPASGSDGLETVAWESSWRGIGGPARMVHATEDDAKHSAEWMDGSYQPLVTREAAEKRIGEERARADRAEERISELADLFGVCDGGRYLNDWKARLNAHQSQVAALTAALTETTGVLDAVLEFAHTAYGAKLILDSKAEAKVSRARSILQALALKEGR